MKCLGLDFYLACLRFNFLNLFLFVVLEILNHNLKYDLYLIFLHIWILLRELLNLPMLFVYQLGHRLTRLLCNRPFRGFNKTQILFPCHLAVGRDSEGWCGSSAVQQAEPELLHLAALSSLEDCPLPQLKIAHHHVYIPVNGKEERGRKGILLSSYRHSYKVQTDACVTFVCISIAETLSHSQKSYISQKSSEMEAVAGKQSSQQIYPLLRRKEFKENQQFPSSLFFYDFHPCHFIFFRSSSSSLICQSNLSLNLPIEF